MRKSEKWIQTAIGTLIGTLIVTTFTGQWQHFFFSWYFSIPLARLILSIFSERKEKKSKKNESKQPKGKPFIVSEHYDRMEKASLEILEERKPMDQTIILWIGLDGLRFNEGGELEWISRKKQKPVNQNICYQPAQSMAQASYPLYNVTDMCQSTRAQINALQAQNTALQIQATQQAQNTAMMAALQSYVVPYPYYPYGGGYGLMPGMGGCGGAGYVSYYWQ